jgi:hypothetical protein
MTIGVSISVISVLIPAELTDSEIKTTSVAAAAASVAASSSPSSKYVRGEPYALYIKNFFIHLRSKMGERFINIAASKRKKSLPGIRVAAPAAGRVN